MKPEGRRKKAKSRGQKAAKKIKGKLFTSLPLI
jgi:hypothetical protein